MKIQNPIIRGFYPDPSICEAEGKYYIACSSFQFFPGVPIFESEDLMNWKQVANALTRTSQVELHQIPSSGGVFAPTLRYHDGTFYMVTNNNTFGKNFYITTTDIRGEWSEPIFVDQEGIDPSLLFDEDGKVYFTSNGSDENGKACILQCEIDVKTGEKLTDSIPIWTGSGGRYIESPHLYHIGDWYYLMVAEGGTEYGHMITYARSESVWGPFESYPKNPVLTNRNKAPYIIQGIGHGDLIQSKNGDWFILCLGFRQIHQWMTYHHLGREVFLTPVEFDKDGWFTAGKDGTTDFEYEIKGNFEQTEKTHYTFENTDKNIDWCFLRHPVTENYDLTPERFILKGTDITLDMTDTPTFVGIRQRDFDMELSVNADVNGGEGGVTLYMCESEHYDIAIRKGENGFEAVLKLNIGNIKHTEKVIPLKSGNAKLIITSDSQIYKFFVKDDAETYSLGYAFSK